MLVYFVVGFSTCKDLAAVSHLCHYLKWRYSQQFHYKKIVTPKACYKAYALTLCKKFSWRKFTGSPMIWKQSGYFNTKVAEFIGDENRFQELMHEIYGVETFIPCEEKLNLAKDEHNFFLESERRRMKAELPHKRHVMCIMNAAHSATRALVVNILMGGKAFENEDCVEIRLFEEKEELKMDVELCIQDAMYLSTGGNLVHSVTSLEESLLNCELLIIMPETNTSDEKSYTEMLLYNWRFLAEKLNTLEPNCKILLFPTSHLCFKLTILVEFLHKVRAFDILGVTEDLALTSLSEASEKSSIPKQDFLTVPSVWGFVGHKHLVDICNMKWSHTRSMTDGKFLNETRKMMEHHSSLQAIWGEKYYVKEVEHNQVSATIELIKEWFTNNPSGRVFSAAVLSDGTFDIPVGLYFSQPVICLNHEWIPFHKHPLPSETMALSQLYEDFVPIIESFQLGRKWKTTLLDGDELSDMTPNEIILDHPLSHSDRFELKKYLGKRNELYPIHFKQNINNIGHYDASMTEFGEEHTNAEERVEAIEINTDRLDFLIDEYKASLMEQYGVTDTVEEEQEELDFD